MNAPDFSTPCPRCGCYGLGDPCPQCRVSKDAIRRMPPVPCDEDGTIVAPAAAPKPDRLGCVGWLTVVVLAAVCLAAFYVACGMPGFES